jgi:hypothetical protein
LAFPQELQDVQLEEESPPKRPCTKQIPFSIKNLNYKAIKVKLPPRNRWEEVRSRRHTKKLAIKIIKGCKII